ncbi:MAG TPA: MraY family glycosyltransferase [Bryobacteraceae bacterium]|jgi:UDP-GlcNAc:undecaprenyl-phosphate GlcNAc-1-phosphate transferase|nr:MraY family glycosyltransferase [Bryobacteraceae bacterium]
MYSSLAIVFLGALVLSAMVTPISRNVALWLNLVDRPDGTRKLHRRPIPRVGGIAILLSMAAAYICLTFLPFTRAQAITAALASHWPFLVALAVVFATGFADDIAGLTPRQKLLGLAIAAGLVCVSGIQIHSLGPLHLPVWLAVPVTILWLAACATAFNLIDGLDGLATGVALIAATCMLVAASLAGPESNYLLALALVPMAGALLGFLPYNFNPASIFLGDSGSLMIGFLLGCAGVLWSHKSVTVLDMTAPLMALAIPLLDAVLSVTRRFLRGRPIFAADRGHIHHRLLDLGFSSRQAAVLLYGACLLAGAFSLAESRPSGGVWLIVLFCAVVWLGIQTLGYVEFGLAGRLMLSGAFRSSIDAQLNLRTVENSLRAAESLPECWTALCEACRLFGFTEARIRCADRMLQKQFGNRRSEEGWNVRISLPGGDYINFTRPPDSEVLPMGVAPLLDLVGKVMAEKCLVFSEFVPTLSPVTSLYEIDGHRRRAADSV